MTGTASTEAGEFAHTYDLQVVSIPTNRADGPRSTTPTTSTRPRTRSTTAAIDDIAERYEKGQPVLVGTISVEKSEKLSRELQKKGIPHEVLNAKQHEREAEIVAQAGTARRRSRSPPTWPAAASTSCSAATPRASPAASA